MPPSSSPSSPPRSTSTSRWSAPSCRWSSGSRTSSPAAASLLVGPSRAAAEIEGSKVFTKEFCLRHGIPTARAKVVRNRDEAAAAVKELGVPVVFKADGLAAGKGVQVCRRKDEVEEALARFFEERAFGAAGEQVLVEECLEGDEVSFMVLTDGGERAAPRLGARLQAPRGRRQGPEHRRDGVGLAGAHCRRAGRRHPARRSSTRRSRVSPPKGGRTGACCTRA